MLNKQVSLNNKKLSFSQKAIIGVLSHGIEFDYSYLIRDIKENYPAFRKSAAEMLWRVGTDKPDTFLYEKLLTSYKECPDDDKIILILGTGYSKLVAKYE